MFSLLIATALPELPPLPQALTKEQMLLQRIMGEHQRVERKFGECSYAWNQWKLSPEGARTTSRFCKGESVQAPVFISVNCSLLKVNMYKEQQWQGWKSPIDPQAKKGEPEMVAALCANVLN